jgi:hypothetical protein
MLPVASGNLHSLAGLLLMQKLIVLAALPYRAVILPTP